MKKIAKLLAIFLVLITIAGNNSLEALAQTEFNPHFIISDAELQDSGNWTRNDIQRFLDSKDSYLSQYQTEDADGAIKSAADIIFEAAQNYNINPKFILVTLQKEQSLVTDDAPTQKQLDWAAGYAVCDSCSTSDAKILKFKGFGKQVDNAAGVMRWYYNHSDQSFIKKKDAPTKIDELEIIPQSWATAFLYTYTPHLHGNKNFHRIWDAWFEQMYPNGTLLKSASSSEMWLLQNGVRHRFKNQTALITRVDPKLAVTITDVELNNYPTGPEISFPNYSILQSSSENFYLLDYDTLRPFASPAVVRQLGYNPDEIISVTEADIAQYPLGSTITTTTTAPQGIIYQIPELDNSYYLLKDGILYPIIDHHIIDTNYKTVPIEKRQLKELTAFPTADQPVTFQDGTLLRAQNNTPIYVMDKGKRRRLADQATFRTLGYKPSNIVSITLAKLLTIPEGEKIFINSSLASARNKFLGDSAAPITDEFKSSLPSYLVAEYPSGRIISGKNIDTPRSIASLTKLLTAYEALNQNFTLDEISAYNNKKYASDKNTLQLKEGERIKNKDILSAMLIVSANNTARMVAQNSGLTEQNLLSSINDRLSEWGADNTHIADVTGLSADNRSSARDLLKIFTKVLEEPVLRDALNKSTYSFQSLLGKNKSAIHRLKNTNQLMFLSKLPYKILASKTGYTPEAGSVMAMLVTEKSGKNKKQYIIITLGNDNYSQRFGEPHKMAIWITKENIKVATKK